jgi:hypothetical protein
MSWSRFATESPELAAMVRARFEAHPHHIIATLRADGSPRASGTNIHYEEVDGEVQLTIGSMAHAVKAHDLYRDPRYSLHSAPLDEQLDGGDAKVSGTAGVVGTPGPDDDTSWVLDVHEAAVVEVEGDQLRITSWTPETGTRERKRT